MILLSDEPELNNQLLHPRQGHQRTYWVQVEGIPPPEALKRFNEGIIIQGHKTLPANAWILDPQPQVPPRDPPIRFRKNIPTCWIGLVLSEGKNRQVRRMTAAVGFPTLRLIRIQIGQLALGDLAAGEWKILSIQERNLVFQT